MLRMEAAKCRLCLGTLGGSRSYLWECSFRSAIEQVFWFKITPSEGLPSFACHRCCSFVRKFHKYGLSVQKNQTEFRKELTDTHPLGVGHSESYESTGELEEPLRLSSSDDEGQEEADSYPCKTETTEKDILTKEIQRRELEVSFGSNGSESSLADNEHRDTTYQPEDESDLHLSEDVSDEERAPKRKYLTRSVKQAKRTKQSKQSEPGTDVNANVEEKSTTAGGTETEHMYKDLVHAVKDEAPTDIFDVTLEDSKGLLNLVNVKLESGEMVSGAVAGNDTATDAASTDKALCATVPLPADVGNYHSGQTSRRNNDIPTKAGCKSNAGIVQNEPTGERSKTKGKTKKKKREKICTSFADIWREFSKYCTGTVLTKDDIDRCNKSASTLQRDSRRASSKKSLRKTSCRLLRDT